MVGFYQMITQDFNVQTKRVKVPTHKAMQLTHNAHFIAGLTVEEAIDKNKDGFEEDDWISDEQKQKAIATDNHWMITVFAKKRGEFFVYSGSDVDVLLEYVSRLDNWRDGE